MTTATESQLAQHDSENSKYSLRIASSEIPRLRMTRHSTERSHKAENLQNDTLNRALLGLPVGPPVLENSSHLIAVQVRHERGNICDCLGEVEAPDTIPPDPIVVTPSETKSSGQNTCGGRSPHQADIGRDRAEQRALSVVSKKNLKREHGRPLADFQALSNMMRE